MRRTRRGEPRLPMLAPPRSESLRALHRAQVGYWKNRRMLERALCPTLVGRDEQLFALEDALLAAHRGESRFVALGGEAGMGKTRLARELAKRAQRLDWEVLWGACSEAELPLPYLPLVEALGNYLSREDVERLGGLLGAAPAEPPPPLPQPGGR